MSVTVVIPSLAGVTEPYLQLCVESLRKTVDWPIIVVTNGTEMQPSLKHIKGISKHLHTREQGQCVATNIGAQMVETPYMMVSNDDMYYAPGWNKLLKFSHPVFSPNLVEPTNNPGSAAPFLKLDAGFTLDEFDQKKVDMFVSKRTVQKFEVVKKEPEAGFNLPFFIKMDLWNLLKGYDEAYDPWGSNSDTDLQTRINLAGVTPMRQRDMLVYHFSNKAGTFDGTHQTEYINNLDYFHNKFGFDRDELGSDVWYNKDMLPKEEDRIWYDQAQYRKAV